jgi:hypothetical protein
MTTIVHGAIVVTGQDLAEVRDALERARDLGLLCSEIADSRTNRVASFFLIVPDGGASPGMTSQNGDAARRAWKEWASGRKLQWVHVRYGANPPSIVDDSHHGVGLP